MRVRYSTHRAREPLVLQRGTIASIMPITTTLLSINDVTFLCKNVIAVVMFLRCQTESKTIVKENILQTFCFQEYCRMAQERLGSFSMEIIAYKGRPFSVFDDGFVSHFAQLQLYSNHLVLSFSKRRG